MLGMKAPSYDKVLKAVKVKVGIKSNLTFRYFRSK
jgi:hypothetical protein